MFSKFGIPLDPVTGRDVVIQPKLGYRFRIRFLQFGGLESTTYSFDAMQQVMNVTRPKITMNTKKIGTYAGSVTVINKPTFEPITVTFRDDMANTLGSAIATQLQKQYDFLNGRYAISSGSAKFTMIIETMDSNNTIRAVDAFKLENCILSNVDFGSADYTSSTPIQVSFTVEYDYLGGYYSETYGVDDAIQLLWHVTTLPVIDASKPSTPFNGNDESFVDKVIGGATDFVKGIFS